MTHVGALHWSENGTAAEVLSGVADPIGKQIALEITHFSALKLIYSPQGWVTMDVRWSIPSIKWYLEPTPAGQTSWLTKSLIESSLGLWQTQTGAFTFVETSSRSSANLIFEEAGTLDANRACPRVLLIPQTVVLTTVGVTCFDDLAQHLQRNLDAANFAIIKIASLDLPTRASAQRTVAHEIGHAIGIHHPVVLLGTPPQPLMQQTSLGGGSTLHALDLAALHHLYGPPPMMDLTVPSVLVPGFMAPGQRVTTSYTLRNAGTAPVTAGSYVTRFYLSLDPAITTADTQVGGTTFTPALAAGATSSTLSDNVDVPAGLAPGTYYFGIIVDPFNTVAESDESNNVGMAMGTITVSAAPLSRPWCGATLDFSGGQLPPGWNVSLIRSGPGLAADRLEGRPVDSGAEVFSPTGAGTGTSALLVDYDALNDYTFWGMHHRIGLVTATGFTWYLYDQNATFNFGSNVLAYRTAYAMTPGGQSTILTHRTTSFSYGAYHYSVRVTLDQVAVTVTSTATGQPVWSFAEVVSGLNPAAVTQVRFESYTTTDNLTWADNVSIGCQ